MEADAITNLVIKKMNQMFKPTMRAPKQNRFPKPYECGLSGGEHLGGVVANFTILYLGREDR